MILIIHIVTCREAVAFLSMMCLACVSAAGGNSHGGSGAPGGGAGGT